MNKNDLTSPWSEWNSLLLDLSYSAGFWVTFAWEEWVGKNMQPQSILFICISLLHQTVASSCCIKAYSDGLQRITGLKPKPRSPNTNFSKNCFHGFQSARLELIFLLRLGFVQLLWQAELWLSGYIHDPQIHSGQNGFPRRVHWLNL